MAHEDYSKIAKECMGLEAVNFSFQGGEPLFVPDLTDIVSRLYLSRNGISITTNVHIFLENISDESIESIRNRGLRIPYFINYSTSEYKRDFFRSTVK